MKKKNLLITVLAILGFAITSIGQIPTNIPTNGLVGWWPFNGNANDESGNMNNGIVDGATSVSDRDGNSNSAYSFAATNKIQIPHNSIYNSTELSISLWFTSDNFTSDESLISKRENSGWGNSFELNAAQSNGLNGIGTSWSVGGNNAISHYSQSILTNQWNNFIFIWASDSVKIYLNGFFLEGTTVSGGMNFNSLPITIGSRGNGWNQVVGKIDDIAIWSRALSQNEINILYPFCSSELVLTQPEDQNTISGNSIIFATTSNDPNSTYQWQTDLGVGFQNLNSVGQFSGTLNDTLTVANVTMGNNNQPFRCIISSGSCIDTSNIAVLYVNNNVGINDFTEDNLFPIYPNPAQNIINVKPDAQLVGSVYTIFDNIGKIVLSGKINSENTAIELGNLSGGVYMFTFGENMKQTFKIIKAE